MTRTVVVGKSKKKKKEVYNLCRRMTEETEASNDATNDNQTEE